MLNAGSAWAKPVVTSLTGVSAFAASTTPVVDLRFTHLQASAVQEGVHLDKDPWYYTIFKGLSGSAGVELNFHSPVISVSSIQLAITVPKVGMVADASKVVIGSGSTAKWTCTSATVAGDNIVYAFSWTGGPILSTSGNRDAVLSYTLPGDGSPTSAVPLPKTISATAVAPGVGAAAIQASAN